MSRGKCIMFTRSLGSAPSEQVTGLGPSQRRWLTVQELLTVPVRSRERTKWAYWESLCCAHVISLMLPT